jgi:hypothetical protein
MPGLIEDTTGLYYGQGLSFEPSLGGAGLTNTSTIDTVLFTGAGNLVAATKLLVAARATFGGSGSFSVHAS